MNSYAIGAARHENGKLVEVAIQCIDEPLGPYLYECEETTVSDVIERIRSGDKVVTLWSLPGWGGGTIPVEIVTLPNGEESIEVVAQGQPEGYRMVNLPRLTTSDSATSGG
mgnify:CR=1 FL=1